MCILPAQGHHTQHDACNDQTLPGRASELSRGSVEHNWFTCRDGRMSMRKVEGAPSKCTILRLLPGTRIACGLLFKGSQVCAHKPSSCVETSYTCATKEPANHPTISARCNGHHIQHSGVTLRARWDTPQQGPCVYASGLHPTSDNCVLMLLQTVLDGHHELDEMAPHRLQVLAVAVHQLVVDAAGALLLEGGTAAHPG